MTKLQNSRAVRRKLTFSQYANDVVLLPASSRVHIACVEFTRNQRGSIHVSYRRPDSFNARAQIVSETQVLICGDFGENRAI